MQKLLENKAMKAVLYMTILLCLLASSCLFDMPSAYGVQETGDDYQVRCEWNYANKRWRYEVDIPKAIYNYFSNQRRSGDYSAYAYNEFDDDWLGYTANSFEEIVDLEGWGDVDIINFVMSFVQCLPYEYDDVTTGYDEYPRYPIETMIDGGISGGVDCEDTVVLLVTILSEMGYDTALLLFAAEEHMAAGVGISQAFVDAWDGAYPLTYVEKDGILYAYCETTGEGHRLGQKPEKIIGITYEVLPIVPTP